MQHDEEGDTLPPPMDAATRRDAPFADTQPKAPPGGHGAPPGTVVGEFELVRVIGEGGFGIVYEAKDLVLLRHVALKEFMPVSLAARGEQAQVKVRSERFQEAFDQGMRSFINEARLLVRFDHPSLVKAYRFWESNGTAYMVMPLYRGSTLKQALKALDRRPDQDWLLSLLDPLTEALHVLHSENCFHRDIAPDNILLLEGDERPVLIDFGAARQVIGDATQTLTAILKPGFAPVEQYADSPDMVQGPWTDAYALAATIHFAITGSTPPTAVGRLIEDKYIPLAKRNIDGYTPQFLAALDRALGVTPLGRTASMAEFRADLGLHPLGERTIRVSRVALDEHRAEMAGRLPAAGARAKPKVHPALAGLAIAAVGAVVAALWWASRGNDTPAKDAALAPPQGAKVVAPAASAAPTLPAANEPTTQAVATTPSALSEPAAQTTPTPAALAQQRPEQQASNDISAQFQSIIAAQTPGFAVEASAAKPVLKIGKDRFSWRVRSARDGFLHILALGPDGTLLLLFPNELDRKNKVRAGQSLALPRATWQLGAAEPPGREELLFFVSSQPRTFDGLGTKHFESYLRLPTGDGAKPVQAAWRHATPWMMGAVLNCEGSSCMDYGAALVVVEVRQ